jgi:hypothetical protein
MAQDKQIVLYEKYYIMLMNLKTLYNKLTVKNLYIKEPTYKYHLNSLTLKYGKKLFNLINKEENRYMFGHFTGKILRGGYYDVEELTGKENIFIQVNENDPNNLYYNNYSIIQKIDKCINVLILIYYLFHLLIFFCLFSYLF